MDCPMGSMTQTIYIAMEPVKHLTIHWVKQCANGTEFCDFRRFPPGISTAVKGELKELYPSAVASNHYLMVDGYIHCSRWLYSTIINLNHHLTVIEHEQPSCTRI